VIGGFRIYGMQKAVSEKDDFMRRTDGGDTKVYHMRCRSWKRRTMATIRPSTGAQRVDRPRIRIQPPVPFSRSLSAALDDLELQLQMNPGRWKKRLIRLTKLLSERRVPSFYLGGPGR